MLITHRKPALAMALLAFAAVVALLTSAFDGSRVADAQEGRSISDGFTIVAFDVTLNNIEDVEAAQLAAKMVLSQAETGLIFVGQYSDHAEEPVEFDSADNAKVAVDEIAVELEANVGGEPEAANLSEMLESYASFIGTLGSGVGGRLVVLSAGGFTFHESAGVAGLANTAADLAAQDVVVGTVSLATTPGGDRDVLAEISSAGGGWAYDLGFLDGVVEFINNELSVQLNPSLQVGSASSTGETINVDVPPHSTYLVAGFAFDDETTTNVIEQPNGQEIGDSVGSVSVISISGMKFFTVRNPQPGSWALRSTEGSGSLTMYSDVINDIRVDMPLVAPFPTGVPIVMTANAMLGELPLIDSSATIDAVVTSPDGAQQEYELNDLGEDGDEFSEDGTFSAMVPAQELVGFNEAGLTLRWPNISASIEGAGGFVVEPFPSVAIEVVGLSDPVVSNARTHLATVDLLLGEHPFLAEQDGVSVTMVNAEDGTEIEVELEPVEVVDDKVYQLRVFASVDTAADYVFSARVVSTHLDRAFEARAVDQTRSVELTSPFPLTLVVVGSIGGTVGFVLLMLILVALVRPKPYGYLYRLDVKGERELVADFGSFHRSAWDWLMHKSIIPAAALPGVPLLGGRFVFSNWGLIFDYKPNTDGLLRMTVRGEGLETGRNRIPDNEHFNIGPETFVFDRSPLGEDVRVSDRLRPSQQARNAELDTFALDPMTWDAPSSARPTRRMY